MPSPKDAWVKQLPSEVNFWVRVAREDYPEYEKNLIKRASGLSDFPKHLSRFLRKDGAVTRILDIGAGPHTVIGPVGAPSPIDIFAIDPLAAEYENLLSKKGITPFVRTVYGEAEAINPSLNNFDIVYSRNALDHSYDPVAAFRSMTKAMRPGEGVIFIEGSVNEGEAQKYSGLHQWNFSPNGDDLII